MILRCRKEYKYPSQLYMRNMSLPQAHHFSFTRFRFVDPLTSMLHETWDAVSFGSFHNASDQATILRPGSSLPMLTFPGPWPDLSSNKPTRQDTPNITSSEESLIISYSRAPVCLFPNSAPSSCTYKARPGRPRGPLAPEHHTLAMRHGPEVSRNPPQRSPKARNTNTISAPSGNPLSPTRASDLARRMHADHPRSAVLGLIILPRSASRDACLIAQSPKCRKAPSIPPSPV